MTVLSLRLVLAAGFALAVLGSTLAPLNAQPLPAAVSPRLALVIGNGAYRAGSLATTANDAGLMAEALRQAGYDVVGARDLDQDSIRKAFRDFLEKAQTAGPEATAVVYLSGYGLQFAGENYYVPVEATLSRDSAIPIETVRLSDFTRALAATPLKARVVVLDLARANPFLSQEQTLAGGLALMDPEPATLYAFNAAPGTVGPNEPGPYGTYATALNEMMREGLPINDIFTQVRLRVNEKTQGLEVPWNATSIRTPFTFFERAPDAPPLAALSSATRSQINQPLQSFSAEDAYGIAVERDTLRGYQEFLKAYPTHPLARRVRALLAARREAITWDQTWRANTPDAYWTYLRRYPRGPHARDANRRLAFLSQPLEPPAGFVSYDYQDLPPPPPEEVVIVDRRPYVEFDDDDYAPPPPPPVFLIDRPRRDYDDLPPPPPPERRGFLPIPIPLPLPFSRPPGAGSGPGGGAGRGAGAGGPPQGQIQQFVTPGGPVPPAGTPQPFQGGPRLGGPRVGQPGSGQPPAGLPGRPPVATAPVPVPTAVPPTPVPATGAPVTGAPVTGAPVLGAPVLGAPVSGAPVSGAPVSGAPPKTAPLTAVPRPAPALPVPATGVTAPQHALPVPPAPQPAPQVGLPRTAPVGTPPQTRPPVVPPNAGPRPLPPVTAAPVQPRPTAPAGPSPADLARQRQQQLQLQQQQQQKAAQQAAQAQAARAAQAAQAAQAQAARAAQDAARQRAAAAQQQAAQRAQQAQAAQQQQQAAQRAQQAAQQRAAQQQQAAQQRAAQQAAQQRAAQQAPHEQPKRPACGHPNEPPCPR